LFDFGKTSIVRHWSSSVLLVGSHTNHERIPQSYGLRYSKSTDLADSSETLDAEKTGYSDVGPLPNSRLINNLVLNQVTDCSRELD